MGSFRKKIESRSSYEPSTKWAAPLPFNAHHGTGFPSHGIRKRYDGSYMGPIPFLFPLHFLRRFSFRSRSIHFSHFLHATSAYDSRTREFLHTHLLRPMKIYARTLSTPVSKCSEAKAYSPATLAATVLAVLLPFAARSFPCFPKPTKITFSIYLDLPDGTHLIRLAKQHKRLQNTSGRDPDILRVESFVGAAPIVDFNGLFKGSSGRMIESKATLVAHLTKPNNRNSTSGIYRISNGIPFSPFPRSISDAVTRIIEDPPGPSGTFNISPQSKGEESETQRAHRSRSRHCCRT